MYFIVFVCRKTNKYNSNINSYNYNLLEKDYDIVTSYEIRYMTGITFGWIVKVYSASRTIDGTFSKVNNAIKNRTISKFVRFHWIDSNNVDKISDKLLDCLEYLDLSKKIKLWGNFMWVIDNFNILCHTIYVSVYDNYRPDKVYMMIFIKTFLHTIHQITTFNLHWIGGSN